MPRIAVLLAPGFEEIEAVTVVDVLRRAELEVTIIAVGPGLAVDAEAGPEVEGSHGITLRADRLLSDAREESWDLVVLPGGLPGSHHLRDRADVQAFLKAQRAAKRPLAAICAAPIALGKAGLLEGRRATCYPGFEGELSGAECREERVVADRDITTSRGAGTALEFALELVRQHAGEETARGLREGMLVAEPSAGTDPRLAAAPDQGTRS